MKLFDWFTYMSVCSLRFARPQCYSVQNMYNEQMLLFTLFLSCDNERPDTVLIVYIMHI